MTLLGGGTLAIQMALGPNARAARRKPALVLIHGEPDGPALAAPSSMTGMPGQTPWYVPMTGASLPSGMRLRKVSSISGAGATAAFTRWATSGEKSPSSTTPASFARMASRAGSDGSPPGWMTASVATPCSEAADAKTAAADFCCESQSISTQLTGEPLSSSRVLVSNHRQRAGTQSGGA